MTAAGGARYVQAARSVTRGSFIALGASIPISIAVDNLLIAVIVASWLIAGSLVDTLHATRRSPIALFACVWLIVYALGALYSIGDTSDIARALRKAMIFGLIPIAVTLMQDPLDRRRACYAFMAAIAVTSVLAYLRSGGLVPADARWFQDPKYGLNVIFKKSLTQNLLLALGSFLFAVHAIYARRTALRVALGACAFLIAVDVLVLGEGRTGHLALLSLLVYLGWSARGRSGVVIALVVGVAVTALTYAIPGSTLHKRSVLAMKEAEEWHDANRSNTSTGQRLEFYSRTLEMVAQRPILGAGTGGFPEAYRRHVEGTDVRPTYNPHNEYLLKVAELGLAGLALMLGLIWVHWKEGRRLPDPAERTVAGGLLLWLALGAIFSTPLSDHTEALLFVWATGILFSRLPPEPHADLRHRHRAR